MIELIGAAALSITPVQERTEPITPPHAAAAAVREIDGKQIYDAAYFDRFVPQNALDMVRRLPGFSIEGGGGARGFGGTAGNVLIDGERPTSKSGGIFEALQRIPPGSVKRIEVIRGTAGASEAAGQAVVANVVRAEGLTAGTWEARLSYNELSGDLRPYVEGSLTTDVLGWSTSSRAFASDDRWDSPALRITRDASGATRLGESETRPGRNLRLVASTEASRGFAGGALTVNAQAEARDFSRAIDRFGFENTLPATRSAADFRLGFAPYDEWLEGEISASYSRPLGEAWSAKVLGLATYRDRQAGNEVVFEEPPGTRVQTTVSQREETPIELVGRAVFSRGGAALSPEFGAEIAYNSLDTAFSLTVLDASGMVEEIELPSSNVLVEENRGEAFMNLIWQARPKLSFESGIAVEASRITVSGDAPNEQSFLFAKPYGTVIVTPSEGVQLRAGLRRNVGQLDFSDFAASADLGDDRVFAGNPDLSPDTATRASLTVDLRSQGQGALNFELFHEWRQDVLEQILLPSGVPGLGNAGDATLTGIEGSLSLPLAKLLPGGLLEAEGVWLDSAFDDPLTGNTRVLSGISTPRVEIDLRQDLVEKRLAWGIGYDFRGPSERFFVPEEFVFERDPQYSAFIETTRFAGVKARLSLANIARFEERIGRRFFSPDRNGAFDGSQVQVFDNGMVVTLGVEGQF